MVASFRATPVKTGIIALGLVLGGCAYLKPLDAEKMTREQFAADLHCPISEVLVFWVPESDGRYVASGCGHQNSYGIRCGDRYFTEGPGCGARFLSGDHDPTKHHF